MKTIKTGRGFHFVIDDEIAGGSALLMSKVMIKVISLPAILLLPNEEAARQGREDSFKRDRIDVAKWLVRDLQAWLRALGEEV